MRILFTICGRAGSKGIKNKNLRMFCGKPLAYYTLSAIDLYLKQYGDKVEADIAVNSDSKELLSLLSGNSMRPVYVLNRKLELADDVTGKIEVIADSYLRMKRQRGVDYDMVVDLDITSPLRTVKDIAGVVAKHSITKADVTTTVTSARRNPYFNQLKKTSHGYKKVIDSQYTARQQAPEIFDMNASIYAFKPEFLLSGKSILDGYCECVEMYDTAVLDLDHENDLELMEVIAEFIFATRIDFNQVKSNLVDKENT